MCGIAGIFRRGRAIGEGDRVALGRMLATLAHRGPDDEGHYEDRFVLLGHRRLSIIDLSPAGHEPMPNESKDVWLTLNGEIYNFRELRRELRVAGHRFRSQTDAEVLVHGYEAWGLEGLLERVRGMFAFAIYDARGEQPRLWIARDRFGIKPLYYARTNETLVFGSELVSLAASGLVRRELTPNVLTSFLALGSIPAPHTILRAVSTIPPGHYLRVDARGDRLTRYWSLPEFGSGEEDGDEIAEAFYESVRMHLVSDVPLGVFSSGGVDSTALVAGASRFREEPVETLTVVFEDAERDEAPYARRVAERYGTNHHEVSVGSRAFEDALPEIWRAMDQPTVDGVNSFFVSRAAKEIGLKVVLSGLGGDELFLGYPHSRALHRARGFLSLLGKVPPAFRRGLVAPAKRLGPLLAHRSFAKLDFLHEPNPVNLYLMFRGIFTGREIATLVPGAETSTVLESHYEEPLTASADLDFRYYLPNQLLRDTDAMSMAHSIEARVPFLDHELVELAMKIAPERKVRERINKGMFLRALGTALPREVWDRPKQGFTLPMRSWLLALRETLEEETLAGGIFPESVVKRSWRQLARGRAHWSRPWLLVTWVAWLRKFRERVDRNRDRADRLLLAR